MKTRRDILLGLGGLAGLMSMASFAWADAGDLVRISGRAFGTIWQVTVPADADAGGLGADLRKILAGIDQSMSPFRADSVNGGVKPGHWAVQNPASTAGTQASAGRA